MQAKYTIPEKGTLPEPPVECVDPPEVLPEVSQGDLLAYADAKRRFQIAQADYEKKRAALTLQLLQVCSVEPGHMSARLEDDRLIVIEDLGDGDPIRF